MKVEGSLINVWLYIVLICGGSLFESVIGLHSQSQSKLVGSGGVGNGQQGRSTSVSGDGMTACVCGNSDNGIGAVWFYIRTNQSCYNWTQLGGKIVPSDNIGLANFCASCSLNFDGSLAVIGGPSDNNYTGATWVFFRNSNGWFQQGNKLIGSGYVTSSGCGLGLCVRQGISVSLAAVHSNVFVSGSYFDDQRGAIHVFRRNNTDLSWYQVGGKLVGTGAPLNAWFGYCVSTSANGNVIAVAAHGAGGVWIFALNTVTSLYDQLGYKLTSLPASAGFGISVALSYDTSTLVVGAIGDNSNIGAMFAFSRNSTGFYIQQGGKIVGSGFVCATNCVQQGISISLSGNGNVVAVGGKYDNNSIGATWIFTRNTTNQWSQYGAKFSGNDNVGVSLQGAESSVSLSADASVLFVGGLSDKNNIGAAWAFHDTSLASSSCLRPADNEFVIFSQSDCLSIIPDTMSCTPLCAPGLFPFMEGKVTCSNGTLLNALNFCGAYQQTQKKMVGIGAVGFASQGKSTAVSGDGMTACVGGSLDNGLSGAVWFYIRLYRSSFNWTQMGEKVVPFDKIGQSSFGYSCSLNFHGNLAVIGGMGDNDYIGATWVFLRNMSGWFQQGRKLIGSDYGSPSGQGVSVSLAAVASNVFATGSYFDNQIGAVYVFRQQADLTWNQVGDKLVGTGIPLGAFFGYSVAMSAYGNVIAVGAYGDSSVWIYNLNYISLLYVQQENKLTSIPASLHFGISVALSYDATTLVVGASGDNGLVGAMFVFNRNSYEFFIQQGGKNVGSGYVCKNNCVQQGISMSLSADGKVAAVGGSYDNNIIGAIWIFTQDNTNQWLQFGSKLVGGDSVGASNHGHERANSLSADGSVLISGGLGENSNVGAAWAFNNSFIPLASCPLPPDYSTALYSSSCTSPIISGTTCIPTCITNYAAASEWISVYCYNGTLTTPLATCIPIPTLISACPDRILANVSQPILVQGIDFFASYNISCILISGSTYFTFPAVHLSLSTISCSVFWPNTTASQNVQLKVAHNDVFGDQNSLPIYILGACEIQKAGSIPGDNDCVCPRGTFDAGSSCMKCGNGEYQDEVGKSSCKSCGNNQDTDGILGSASTSTCVCQVKYFPNPHYDISQINSEKCLPCVFPGMECDGGDSVSILPGFWRADNNSIYVLPCPGGPIACIGTQQNTTSLCGNGYLGPLCSVCDKNSGYSKYNDVCNKCPNSALNGFYLFLLIVFASFSVYAFIYFSTSSSSSSSSTTTNPDHDIGALVKVLLSFLQITYYVGRLSANWSSVAKQYLTVVGASTMSPNIFSIDCAMQWSFYDRLILVYFSPLLLTTSIMILYFIRHFLLKKTLKASIDDCQLSVMIVLFLIHPTLLLEVVASLPCDKVKGSGSYLRADMSIDCSSREYKSFKAISWLYLIFYIVAAILFLVYRGLYHNYKSGKLYLPNHPAMKKYAFFVKGYKHKAFFWEAVVMTRKLAVVLLSTVLSPVLQLFWAAVFVTTSLFGNIFLEPFDDPFLNRVETISLLVICSTITIGVHYLELGEENDGKAGIIPTIVLIIVNCIWTVFLVSNFFIRAQRWMKNKASRWEWWNNRNHNISSNNNNNNCKESVFEFNGKNEEGVVRDAELISKEPLLQE